MYCKLQRDEINWILKVSIELNIFLKQNFVLMYCDLQRHGINSIKVSFSHK